MNFSENIYDTLEEFMKKFGRKREAAKSMDGFWTEPFHLASAAAESSSSRLSFLTFIFYPITIPN